jgi:hypothetical protein
MSLYFSRDTKVYLKQNNVLFEIPVLDGFEFSQATNASEVTLNEARESSSVSKSKRSRRMFNDSYSPAEWSFSTYIRPLKSTTGGTNDWEHANYNRVHSVEEPLWANFVANNALTKGGSGAASAWADGIEPSGSSYTVVDWTGSEVSELGTFELFFVLGTGTDKVYKITNCCVNEASIEFDIDGIATISWSGFGAKIVDEGSTTPSATTTINEGISDTNNFIRNRLTSLAITAADTTNFPGASSDGVYNTVLTGGSITFSNNITFLTPETLGKVDTPIGHVTGTRNIAGNFTCYLDANADGDVDDLFKHIVEKDRVVSNEFSLTFKVGGASNSPRVEIKLPQCHLEVPTHSIEDVISLDVNFHALTASLDPDTTATNYEATLEYYPPS